MRVIYKRTAVKDMEATRDYIAGRLKNPKAAKKLMTALLKAISLLVDNPSFIPASENLSDASNRRWGNK